VPYLTDGVALNYEVTMKARWRNCGRNRVTADDLREPLSVGQCTTLCGNSCGAMLLTM